MRFTFNNLMFEITRKCNMHCAHCMRGEQQNVTMSTDIFAKIFKNTNKIEHLTLTGGEPSLEPEIIEWLVYYAKVNDVKIGAFFCATNAAVYSEKFVKALTNLYDICYRKKDCGLAISTDQFHSPADKIALIKYKELPFYVSAKETDYLPKANIINEGRADENNLGRFKLIFPKKIYDYHFSGFDLYIKDRLYINALGDLLLHGDMSYQTQKEETCGNVFERPLEDILKDIFYEIPDKYFCENKKCFYGVRFSAEADTVCSIPLDYVQYYEMPIDAISVYQNILNNLQLSPVNPQANATPDNLQLEFVNLPEVDDRCEGMKIIYKQPEKMPKAVTVDIIRCPIEEVKDHAD